jgi:dolichyl-phosphate beta-glucosyltransferase
VSGSCDLSLILPSYRGGELAERSARELVEYLPTLGISWEVVFVDDGGGDMAGLEGGDPRLRVISFPKNRGKGAAVRAGMLAAAGKARIFTDVDLPFELESIAHALYLLRDRGFHMVMGDRTLPQSSYRLHLSWERRLASRIFSDFVGTLVTGGFFDTQCGFKGFRGDVASALFPMTRVDRFAFDVELIYLALKYSLECKRIPVRLRHNAGSSVRLVRDSTRMFVDVLKIKRRQMAGAYASAELTALVASQLERERAALPNSSGNARGPE